MIETVNVEKGFAVLDHIPVGLFVLKRDFTVLFWNRCLEGWTGIPRERIVGADIRSRFPHLNDPKYAIRLQDVFAGGPPTIFSSQLHQQIIPADLPGGRRQIQHTTVTSVQAPDSEEVYALLALEDVTDLTHRITGYRQMRDQAFEEVKERKRIEDELRRARDELDLRVRERTADLITLTEQMQREIGERKQAEEALRESEERFRSIFNNVTVGIILTDTSGFVLALNEAFRNLIGCPREEILGRPISAHVHPMDLENDREFHEDLIRGERSSYMIDKRFLRCNGDVIWGRLSFSLIRDDFGEPLYGTVVCEDITERKRLKKELLRVQKLESVGILAGGIAHDFNNLLTAILGNISLAKLFVKPGDDISARLGEAEKASMRAKDLTQQLLTFSKGGAPVKKTASISDLIKDSTSFALRGSNARSEFLIAPDLWPVDVDEGQISQVINNLIINAAQAMPEGGTVTVRADNIHVGGASSVPLPGGDYVRISIRDEGIGIAEEFIEKIFDPYFTTKSTGNGLGLSTSYSIVKNHDGHITVESCPGAGTTFYVYLPASKRRVMRRTEKGGAVTGSGVVLVMDDEEMVRMVAGTMLHNLGYEAHFARDGQEAIELYRKAHEAGRPFSSVILDLTIPGGMGGKEAIKRLIEIDPGVVAIVSSGYSNDPIMADFTRYGFKGVVVKPYTIEELSHALYKIINGHDN